MDTYSESFAGIFTDTVTPPSVVMACTTWSCQERHYSDDLAPREDPTIAGLAGRSFCGRLAYTAEYMNPLLSGLGYPTFRLDELPECAHCANTRQNYGEAL